MRNGSSIITARINYSRSRVRVCWERIAAIAENLLMTESTNCRVTSDERREPAESGKKDNVDLKMREILTFESLLIIVLHRSSPSMALFLRKTPLSILTFASSSLG